MACNEKKEVEFLKIIYQEIIRGYTPIKNYYVKHFNELDNIDVLRYRINIYNQYIKNGVPSTEIRLKELNDNQEWTKDNEEEILSCKYQISDNEKIIPTIIIPQQQEMIKREVAQTKTKLSRLLAERAQKIGTTAEEFAEQETLNFVIYLSFFKDYSCKISLFNSWEECESTLQEEDINDFSVLLDESLSKFTNENLRKIAVLPFFINIFSHSKDTLHTFLNKSISELTMFQSALFRDVSRNITVLRNSTVQPPELLDDIKVDDIVLWYDKQYQLLISKREEK